MAGEGVVLSYEAFLDSFGQRNDRILANWLGDDTAPDRIQRIGDIKEARYREIARREGLIPLPGAREWVTRLAEMRWRQAVASSAPRANVEVMLEAVRMTAFIDAVVAAEDVTRGKPHPDVFLAAAAHIHVPASRCVVVEDAAAGLEAARRAGMRRIGVNAGTPLDADLYVRSLAELPRDAFERLITSDVDGLLNS